MWFVKCYSFSFLSRRYSFFFFSEAGKRERESFKREFLIREREREIPNENLYIPRLCLFFLAIYRIHSIVFARNSEKNKTERKL